MCRSGRSRPVLSSALAALIAVAAAITGTVPGATPPAAADCGMQAPSRGIAAHRGFAFDGVITAIDLHEVKGEGWLYGITMDVTEMLAGDPVRQVTFDLGSGSCWDLQGDRYKVGDRLIVTASWAPIEPLTIDGMRYLPDALTWRYEWGDVWTLHGLPSGWDRLLSPRIRSAATRDAIVALVAPDALPYQVDPGLWRVALERTDASGSLQDVVAWRDGFVALGSRTAGQGRQRRSEPTIWTSATGNRWDQVPDPFPAAVLAGATVQQLVVFRDALYAVGSRDDELMVWRSADGRRWQGVLAESWATLPPALHGVVVPIGELQAAATDDRLLILSDLAVQYVDTRAVWTSTDGTTFTRSTPVGLTPDIGTTIAIDGAFAISYSNWGIRTSADGVTWTDAGTQPPGMTDLAWDAARSRYLAAVAVALPGVGSDAGAEVSPDALAWSPLVDQPGSDGDVIEVAAAGDVLALLGTRGEEATTAVWTMTSHDRGATWTYAELPRTRREACVQKVAIGTIAIVAIGGCGGVLAWVAGR